MTRADLLKLAVEFDIDDLAVVPARPVPTDPDLLTERVAQVPVELGYLARGLARRLDPDLVMPGTKSIVVGIVSYGGGPARPDPMPDGAGWISRFAWCRDYHETVGNRFAALARAIEVRHSARTKWYVDTGAILEKAWAAAAGLGFIGKNTLLVSPRWGSFTFIGTILTDLDIQATPSQASAPGCGNCNACVRACPNGALDGRGGLDWTKCLAHLNATSRQPIPSDILTGGNIFGCDICQDVCPFNKSPTKPRPEFLPSPGLFCPDLATIAAACANPDSPDGFNRIFAGTPVFRRGPEMVGWTVDRLIANRRQSR